VSKLASHIADVLTRDAAAIGARWRTQAHFVAPRQSADVGDAGARAAMARRLVLTVAGALRGDDGAHDALMSAGWSAGSAAHAQQLPLHYLLKELDLLATMVLYAAEQGLADERHASAADGVALARRVTRGFSLLTLAASKGFTHGYLAGLHQEYRDLRHDLRNPLGTIRSAVALMEDESVPAETRNNPRFRAMVLRNASSLDDTISQRLGDERPENQAFGPREVSLRQIALSVRRDLREQASRKGCEIVVADSLPTASVDPVGFELALTSALTAALDAAPRNCSIEVALRELRERSAVVSVACDAAAPGVDRAERVGAPSDFARALLERGGGRLWAEAGRLCLEVPTSRPLSAAHATHDVAGAR
jgi:signal transduction histidine kinase